MTNSLTQRLVPTACSWTAPVSEEITEAKSSSFPTVPPLLRMWGSSLNSGFSLFAAHSGPQSQLWSQHWQNPGDAKVPENHQHWGDTRVPGWRCLALASHLCSEQRGNPILRDHHSLCGTAESFSCIHTCTPPSQEKPPFINYSWNLCVIRSRLLELHSCDLFYELSTQLQATPAHLLDTTTTRNNKLLEGHSKLITSWELRINTVLWNNLKYFDLQGILQGSFNKEINSMFRIEGTKWKWCQRGRTGFSDAFVMCFSLVECGNSHTARLEANINANGSPFQWWRNEKQVPICTN